MQHVFPSVAKLVLLSWLPLCAQDLTPADPPESSNQQAGGAGDDSGWVAAWTRIVEKVRASQPHFVAPIVTTHVMLVQQFRYDMSWQQDPSGGTITSNYGGSRGLEIIPSTRLEMAIFPPSYFVHQSNVRDGFGDFSYQVKFRAFSWSRRRSIST